MMPAAITPCELRRISHRRPSGSVKLHSWITVLGQQGAEPDLRMYAVVHRCERICAILQTRPQGSLCSNQFQPLGSVFGQEGVELQTVQFLYSRAEAQASSKTGTSPSNASRLSSRSSVGSSSSASPSRVCAGPPATMIRSVGPYEA